MPMHINDIQLKESTLNPEMLAEIDAVLSPSWTRFEMQQGREIRFNDIVRKYYRDTFNVALVDTEFEYTSRGWSIHTAQGKFTKMRPSQTPQHLRGIQP